MQLTTIALPFLLLVSTSTLITPQTAPPVAPAPAVATQGGSFTIDDVHSCSLVRVHHSRAGQFWGRFNTISGTFTLSPDTTKMAFDVTIAVESVDTGNERLDGHLKSPDFFNVKEFPSMTFKSTGCAKNADETFALTGDLTIHGVTKSVTATIEVTGWGFDGGRGARAGAEARFKIKRSEFGMSSGTDTGALGDETAIIIGLEGTAA